MLVGSDEAVKCTGLKPRARIRATADVSANRTLALTAAVDATHRALARAGLAAKDIDLFEVNESFAALMLLASVVSVALCTQSPALKDPFIRGMIGE